MSRDHGSRHERGRDGPRGPPPDTKTMYTVKVDNLTYRTVVRDVEYLFEKYGKVGDVYIPKDRFTRESRGFAFVRFYEKRDAEDALDALDGRKYDGRELRVEFAKYGRTERSRGGQRGGRNFGGRSRSRSRDRKRSRSRDRRRSRSRNKRRSRSRSQSRSRSRSRSGSRKKRSKSDSKSRSRSREKETKSHSKSKKGERSHSKSRKEDRSRSKSRSKSKSKRDERSRSKSKSKRDERSRSKSRKEDRSHSEEKESHEKSEVAPEISTEKEEAQGDEEKYDTNLYESESA